MATKDDELTEMLGVRISKDDAKRLDAIVDRLPVATKHGIARLALRLGLDAIERDPMLLLGGIKSKGSKR